jgi:hypothetical protein
VRIPTVSDLSPVIVPHAIAQDFVRSKWLAHRQIVCGRTIKFARNPVGFVLSNKRATRRNLMEGVLVVLSRPESTQAIKAECHDE